MKKLIQKAVKVLAFLLVLALCYGLMDQVLKIKTDDMVSMVKLRQLPPDTVDVLLVGSSHIGTNVDNQPSRWWRFTTTPAVCRRALRTSSPS